MDKAHDALALFRRNRILDAGNLRFYITMPPSTVKTCPVT